MSRHLNTRTRQRGLVLVSSLLLLLVVTMLALAMFRSMGLAEKISGNVREKQRALHAAVVAEQYAEWWLSNTAIHRRRRWSAMPRPTPTRAPSRF